MIKDNVHHKPTLDSLYYNQAEAVIETVPADIPLHLVLANYIVW